MNTLVEYAKLSTDALKAGIADTIVKESELLRRMPLVEINGNSYKYNLESALADASWFNVGDTWVEGTPNWEQRSVALSILGGDADVDKFVQQTRSNVQDQKAAVIEKKAKAIAYEFEKQAVLGGTTTQKDAKSMEGLLQLIAECESTATTDLDAGNNGQVIKAADASAALTLDMMDELIDAVKPGRPDAIMMSRRMRRKLNALARAAGANLEHDQDQLGFPVQTYGGIPVLINDWIKDNFQDGSSGVLDISSYDYSKTRASGYDNSVILVLKFGEDGVACIHNGGIQTEDLGTLQVKDATRTRIKFYCGAALFGTLKAAVLINVLDTAL